MLSEAPFVRPSVRPVRRSVRPPIRSVRPAVRPVRPSVQPISDLFQNLDKGVQDYQHRRTQLLAYLHL